MTTTKEFLINKFLVGVKGLRPDWPSDFILSLASSVLEEQQLNSDTVDIGELEACLDCYLDDLVSYLSEKEDFIGDYPSLENLIEDLEVSYADNPRMPEAMEWELDPKEIGSLADEIRDLTNAAYDLRKKLKSICIGHAMRTENEIKEIILELLK